MTQVSVLGDLEVLGAAGPIPIRALKLRQLLGALVVSAGEVRSADWLADAIWGGAPPPSADKLLQVYVSRLRKLLPADLRLITRGAGYVLELDAATCDALRFEQLADEGRRALQLGNALLAGSLLRRALSLWRGRAFGELADYRFVTSEAARLDELRLIAIEDRIDAELATGRHQELSAELGSLADCHPARERLQAQAMLCLYRTGRHTEALQRFAELRATLDRELGLVPGPAVTKLQRQILNHDPALSVIPVTAPSVRLPAPPSPIVGRERELDELGDLLSDEEVRLIVLTGAGGSGKTRLAIEAARRHVQRFANGVAFVALASVRDPRRMPAMIAHAVGLRDSAQPTLEQLLDFVADLELLVLVDNLEHLQAVAPALVTILTRAPRVTLMVTSRSVLHLSGEHVYPVRPLSPDDATTLFHQRARAANPSAGFDGEVVAAICERLDRLPLAIELAASRMRLLSPPELLAGLELRLPLLTAGPRDLPARQQTMSATIGWSHDLLEEPVRCEFRRMSVFAAGCTLEAARAVCASSVESVGALVDDSLLHYTATDGDSRYRMLETVREYATERLVAAGEAADVAARHLEYFLELAERCNLFAEAELPQDFATVNREQENLRAAIGWARTHGRRETGLRLAVALENFWVTHDAAEGAQLLTELIEPDGDPVLHARALRALGGSRQALGELDAAERHYRDSLVRFTGFGDEKGIAILDYRLGLTAVEQGEIDNGARALEQSLEIFRAIGSGRGEAQATGALGRVALARGNRQSARKLFERSAAMCERIGRPWWQALMLAEAAQLALADGDLGTSTAHSTQLLELAVHIGDPQQTRLALLHLARAAACGGDLEWAGRLCGALITDGADLAAGAEHLATMLARPDPDLARGRRHGETLTLAQVIDEALAIAARPGARSWTGRP